ncbi:SwmB domain-containing protein [Acinetobacter sp. UBA3025]|uniref:SwmB domain-containing protein n=1 Tax=Acinetobacter sp. UBA3025 TaxID=1945933 RepID=UPI0025C0F6A8|nr:SwmB domain-containing protein [Acinetobacter sp. UBA3025]
MANIQILSAENGELIQDINTNIVNLSEKSVIKVNATIDEVAKITRQGNSAVIYFKNGETITIENYFDYAVNDNRIVFEHEGQLYWAEFTDENGVMLDTIRYHPLTGDLAESGTVAAGILPWLGGALALGAIAAAAGGGSSSGSSSDNRDMSPPKLTGVIVNEEGQLELSFDENINDSNPRAEDFTVVVDGEEIPVNDIIVQDDKIILITEPEIRDGQEVTVEYQDSTPDDNQGIKDSEGNVLEDLDSDDVGGVQNPDISGPVLLAAEVNANGNIELSFNEALDADNLPPLDSLVVTVGTAPDQTTVDVINIVADGNTLTLITSPVIAAGQTVSVEYTNPTSGNDENAIQDLAGNDAASFNTVDLPNGVINDSEQPVVDTASPVLIDAEVNADGNIELSFNEDVSTSNPLPADFTVVVDGTEIPVTDIVYDGNEIFLVTDPVITEGQEVEVTYADSTPGDGQGIRDGSGNVLDGFDAVEVGGVDNNSEQPAEDTVAPVLIEAGVSADGNIGLNFNEDVSTSNPLPADFTVIVDGSEVPVTDIVYDGNEIILVTDPVITEGQEVEVTYADSTPGDGQGIRDGSGNVLDGFDAVAVGGVDNNSEQPAEDTVAPVLIDAEVNADGNIELSFNEDVSTSNPLPADFTVVVDGEEISVTDIIYDGNEIILVTDPVITEGQEVEVTYADSTPGDGQGIRDGSSNVLDSFDAVEVGGVDNNSEQPAEDTVAPVLIDAEVNADGNIELSFNEDVSTSNPLPADFTVIVDGAEIPVTDIVYDGNEIILVTDPVITEGQEVEVTYTDSTPGDDQGIRDGSGNVLDGFDAIAVGGVDNNSEQPVEDTVAPVLIDAEVNADGNIELSFNETLDADNLPPLNSLVVTIGTAPDQTTVDVINIAADGNILTMITNPVITAGQTVSVEYTDPTTGNDDNVIQDLAGNDAASFTTADLPNGVVNNSERLLNLADDNVSAILEGSQDATVLETYSDSSGIDVLNGTSEVAVVDFTIEENISSVVIAVQQENLVSLANAFTFVVRNTTTGEEFEVASANTSQGGLVAGALGLELLGGVADAQGLRLDINDLPAGTYEVSVYGDSSQLADILTTIDLANLGDNTVNNLVSDTVLGLLEATLTGQNADPRGILEQLTLRELLDLTTGSSVPIINTLTTAVDSVLSLALDNILVRPILGDVYNTSVGSLLAGNGGGALGFLLTTLGLGTALDALVNGILEGVDGAGQALFDNLVEPLVSDILLDTVLEDTGLTTGLNTLLGSLNTLLSTLGLGDVLPTVNGLIDLIAQEALSNPLTLFGGTTAEVYEVNGEIYRATGNIQETSADGTQADNWAGGVLTEINGQPVTFDSSDEGGNFTLIEGTYGELKLYENGNFSYEYNSAVVQGPLLSEVFEYTVTRNAGQADQESASANLVINIDRVNQIINYADDPADNLLQGGAGDDILTGGAGADTAIYYLLNNADATGGNGTDTWTDFNAVEGDTIDVSALLSDQAVDASNLGNYITLEQRGDDTVVTIDRDGSDTNTTFARADLLILQNVDSATLQLDDIIKYNPI